MNDFEFDTAFFIEKTISVQKNDGTFEINSLGLVKIPNTSVIYDEFIGCYKVSSNIFTGIDNPHYHYNIRLFKIDDHIDEIDRLHIDEDFRRLKEVPVSYESEMNYN